MGGKFHLRLNTGERPIANKYREGKMKRTLKRELKVLEIVEGEANGSRGAPRFYVGFAPRLSTRGAGQRGLAWREKSRDCYPAHIAGLTEV